MRQSVSDMDGTIEREGGDWEKGCRICDSYYQILEKIFLWLLFLQCTNMEEQVLARVNVEEEN